MNVSEAIATRRSVRAYTEQEVPQETIREIFTKAAQSPSNCNSQPWHVSVVSGKTRKKIEKSMVRQIMLGGKPDSVFPAGDLGFEGVYRQRQVDCAIALYDSQGISYEEKKKRQKLMLKNWQFFGAPHGAFFSMPKSMGPVNSVDVGIYLQSVMLLMTEYGIACCPQGALAFFPKAAYKHAGIPEDHGILFGMSFGYADTDNSINNFEVGRAELSECVNFFE